MTDAELRELVAKAQARYDALSPAEKAAHDQAQRESDARGMGPCEHGVLDFEECADCRRKARRQGATDEA